MTVTALVAVKGSRGVTTLACALGAVWPSGRMVVVAECDPSGGDIAARFGLSTELGMASLVVSQRYSEERGELAGAGDHFQELPGGLAVLVGAVGADAGHALDRELARVGLHGLAPMDVVADCGRLDPRAVGQLRVLRDAERVIMLVAPSPSGLAHARWSVDRVRLLRAPDALPPQLVVSGDGPFPPAEVADAVGVELAAVLPRDPAAASMLRGEPGARRVLARSPLVGAAQRLAPSLTAELREEGLRDAS